MGLKAAELEEAARRGGAAEVSFFGGYQGQPYERSNSVDLLMVAEKATVSYAMRNLDELFSALDESGYRSTDSPRSARPRLPGGEDAAGDSRSCAGIHSRAAGPADPPNDGEQTPRNGHPVFVAQHGTATCCRKCLESWHYIERGVRLTPEQTDYIVRVLERWLRKWLPGASK